MTMISASVGPGSPNRPEDVRAVQALLERRVMAIGVDDTDAYTGGTLAAAGALPADGRRRRIGLIYDVSSPNARFRTAAVLREGNRVAGVWHFQRPLRQYPCRSIDSGTAPGDAVTFARSDARAGHFPARFFLLSPGPALAGDRAAGEGASLAMKA